ncbi:hypothetical protein HMPREF9449_00348 [Odoribacter laneus YIT 12061]|mgnify:CR=1 FL=1|uniref:Uncharacterized protein n=1 Tax=Odoribacter laneus YIT 12061 TaxID=742817 RepID=H1DDL2_9BACT|nr:hypothetical protein HMPREF9449_00348 [Odoribacter laneus YIT 12061]
MDQSAAEYIVVEGANENNLKHLSLKFLKNRLLYLRECRVPENLLWSWIRLLQNPDGN